MLRKFAVALVAASLIAGPALAQTTAPAAQPVQTTAAAPTVKKHVTHRHVAHKHVAHKHVTKKHVAKHHVKKVHVGKVKHHKAVKRIKKPADKTLG